MSVPHPPSPVWFSTLGKRRTWSALGLSPEPWLAGREGRAHSHPRCVQRCWGGWPWKGRSHWEGWAGGAGCVEGVEGCQCGYLARCCKLALNLGTLVHRLSVRGEGCLKVVSREREWHAASQPSSPDVPSSTLAPRLRVITWSEVMDKRFLSFLFCLNLLP